MKTVSESTDAEILASVFRRALDLGAKSVTFSADGIGIVDAAGRAHVLSSEGVVIPSLSKERLEEAIAAFSSRYWQSGWKELETDEFGSWEIEIVDDGAVIKPKKTLTAWMGPLFEDGVGAADAIRALYSADDADILILVEGEPRARAVANAIVTERSLAGLSSELVIAVDDVRHRRSCGWGRAGTPAEAVLIDGHTSGSEWKVHLDRNARRLLAADGAPAVGHGRVMVVEEKGHSARRIVAAAQNGEIQPTVRPLLVVSIVLEKSKPVASIHVDPRLADRVAAGPPEGPWTAMQARRVALAAGRKPMEKTWHPTTRAVAEAFLQRKAPRGAVSGRPIFFHGPVAYSQSQWNPIAALVDFPKGKTAIFMDGSRRYGGGQAGISSSAQGDIITANQVHSLETFRFGDLMEILKVGDSGLRDWAKESDWNRKEAAGPKSASIDRRALRRWFVRETKAAFDELEAASRTEFPTHRKAGAYRWIASIAETRDRLADLMGIKMEADYSAEEYRMLGMTEQQAAQARMDQQRTRLREAAAAERERVAVEAAVPMEPGIRM